MSLLTSLTYVLPHRFLSSLARRLAYSTSPGTKQWLIDTVTKKFNVDLGEELAKQAAAEEKAELLFALERNPGVRQLAANPLLLTMMPWDELLKRLFGMVF